MKLLFYVIIYALATASWRRQLCEFLQSIQPRKPFSSVGLVNNIAEEIYRYLFLIVAALSLLISRTFLHRILSLIWTSWICSFLLLDLPMRLQMLRIENRFGIIENAPLYSLGFGVVPAMLSISDKGLFLLLALVPFLHTTARKMIYRSFLSKDSLKLKIFRPLRQINWIVIAALFMRRKSKA